MDAVLPSGLAGQSDNLLDAIWRSLAEDAAVDGHFKISRFDHPQEHVNQVFRFFVHAPHSTL